MKYDNNSELEIYEIKKPDYDLFEREYVGMSDVKYESARFQKDGEQWKSKRKFGGFFSRKKKEITVMFTGDITCFEKQFAEAQNGKDYDFSYEFEKIKPVFEQADLVVGNLETMIFPNAPYRTEKYVAEQNFHCNAPIEFLDAIRKAGIDVLTNANNHDLDTGAVGIGVTIDNIERFGFIQTGTFKTEKKRYEIIDVEGFKIAIIAFATDHNNKKCNLTEKGVDFLLNDYSKEKAEQIIKSARKDGAEIVFTCIHWGKENKTLQNSEQMKIAKELAQLGYDCIIGSHPHVLQPFTMTEVNNKEVPTFFSMGNFISHNANNNKARSIIACVNLKKVNGKIEMNCSYIPVFTSNNYGEKKYVVIPINARAVDSRNIRKKEQIRKIVGNEISVNERIAISECIEKKESAVQKKKVDELDLKKISSYPVEYDDGKFLYDVYEEYVCLEGLSADATHLSYSVPEKISKIPVTQIKEGAFEGNQIIKKINFKKSITVISERMCKDCVELEGFQLTNAVIEIGNHAFENCQRLSAAVMRRQVKKIGERAFANCTNLRSVKIPMNVMDIADNAFEGCPNVIFYCEKGSYGECYANKHGFKMINMKLE